MVLVVVTLLVIDPELSIINMILGLAAEMPTYSGICAGVMAWAKLIPAQIRKPETVKRYRVNF